MEIHQAIFIIIGIYTTTTIKPFNSRLEVDYLKQKGITLD